MDGFAAWLKGWFDAFLVWLLDQIGAIFTGLWDMLTDFLVYVLDKLFDLVVYIVSGLNWDFSGFMPLQYWNQLPAELINGMNLVGAPVALGMILAALVIRFILQMIPFVRWGS